jgi:O-antigen ligase
VERILDESFGVNIFVVFKYIFIAAGLLIGLGGVVDYIRFHPVRLWTVFGHEIEFLMMPLYIIYFMPVVFCLMFRNNTRPQRILSVAAFFTLFLCVIFTGTRAAWIAVVVSLLFATFFMGRKYLKYFFPGIMVLVGLIYLFVSIRMHDFATYFIRKDIMQAAVSIFRDNIILGAGPGMYEKLVGVHSLGYILHAHNTYLEILAELGIVGLVTFSMIFIKFYWQAVRNNVILNQSINKSLYVGLLTSNFACLIFALFGSIITVGFHDAPMFWLIFGMSFGLGQRLNIESV